MSEKEKYLPKCACFEQPDSPMVGVMVEYCQTMGQYLTKAPEELGLCRATWESLLDMTIINTLSIHVCDGTVLEAGTPEAQFELKERVKMMMPRLLEKIDHYYAQAREEGMTQEKFQAMMAARGSTKQ